MTFLLTAHPQRGEGGWKNAAEEQDFFSLASAFDVFLKVSVSRGACAAAGSSPCLLGWERGCSRSLTWGTAAGELAGAAVGKEVSRLRKI